LESQKEARAEFHAGQMLYTQETPAPQVSAYVVRTVGQSPFGLIVGMGAGASLELDIQWSYEKELNMFPYY